MVLGSGAVGVGLGGVWSVGHLRGGRGGYRRRCLALEVHAHAESDGGLECACIEGRARVIVVDSAYGAVARREVCIETRRMACWAGRGLGDGSILRVPEGAARCDRARLSQKIAAAVAKGAAVLVRRMLVVVVVVGRAVEVLQRYRVAGAGSVLVGIRVGHWSCGLWCCAAFNAASVRNDASAPQNVIAHPFRVQ